MFRSGLAERRSGISLRPASMPVITWIDIPSLLLALSRGRTIGEMGGGITVVFREEVFPHEFGLLPQMTMGDLCWYVGGHGGRIEFWCWT